MCSSQPRSTPSRVVLLGPDPVLDDARDLVAVPGDDPQVGVELGQRERRRVPCSRSSRDGPSGRGTPRSRPRGSPADAPRDRPDLDALGQRRVRDLVEVRRAASGRSGGRARTRHPPAGCRCRRLDVLGPGREPDRAGRVLAGRARPRALDGPARAATSRDRAGGDRGGPRPRPGRSACPRGRSARPLAWATIRPSTSTRTTSVDSGRCHRSPPSRSRGRARSGGTGRRRPTLAAAMISAIGLEIGGVAEEAHAETGDRGRRGQVGQEQRHRSSTRVSMVSVDAVIARLRTCGSCVRRPTCG